MKQLLIIAISVLAAVTASAQYTITIKEKQVCFNVNKVTLDIIGAEKDSIKLMYKAYDSTKPNGLYEMDNMLVPMYAPALLIPNPIDTALVNQFFRMRGVEAIKKD